MMTEILRQELIRQLRIIVFLKEQTFSKKIEKMSDNNFVILRHYCLKIKL
jgi:hypothetical protein